MTNISKSHKRLSERLNDPRVLTNPEEFLGLNYEAVLNFWLFLDELTEKQLKVIEGCYLVFYYNSESEFCKAIDEAYVASVETIGREFAINAAVLLGKLIILMQLVMQQKNL